MQDEYAKDKNMLTIGEAAKFTNLSIDTLRRWEKRGKITAYRSPGGHRYFNKNEISNVFKKRYKRDAAKPVTISPIQNEVPVKEDISADVPFNVQTVENKAETEHKPESAEHKPEAEHKAEKASEAHSVPKPPYHPSASSAFQMPQRNEEKTAYSHHRRHLTPSSVLDKDRQTPPTPKKDTEKIDTKPSDNAEKKPSLTIHKPIVHEAPAGLRSDHTSKDVKPATKSRHLLHSKKEGGLTKFQKFIYGAFIAFVIIDIILIILFRSWLIPLSPIP